MTHWSPKRGASGAQTLPGVVHDASSGRASLPWVHVVRSSLTRVWTFIPLPFVAMATHPSPSGRICGSGKLFSQTGFVAAGAVCVAGVVTVPPGLVDRLVGVPPPQP